MPTKRAESTKRAAERTTQPSKRAAKRAAATVERPNWKPAAGLVTAFVLGVAVAFLLGAWTSGPSATERRIAELEEAEARRDVEQIAVLTDLARGSKDRLTPMVEGMAKAAPADSSSGTVPSAEEVGKWRDAATAELRRYEETPSAGNGVNVARTALRTAVQQLAVAVGGFEAALAAPDPLRGRLVGLASEQRTLALHTWSVAALQLDVINIDSGRGHVHVQLPAGPNATPLDAEPEGSGRR
ncbi:MULTISPECIES: hypothetical protein [unclassified Saccharothrix]|uniref:hypothetical protein n=1 Tax=unclassified Saccharothrix TaxID=2593673 RepID=UPI00307FB64D